MSTMDRDREQPMNETPREKMNNKTGRPHYWTALDGRITRPRFDDQLPGAEDDFRIGAMAEWLADDLNRTLREKVALEDENRRLREALQAASDHLDYCGYGDRWEHSCAVEAGLPKQIADALTQGKGTGDAS